MKIYLSMTLAAMLILGTVSAQHSDAFKHVNIGIKGGLNFYDINNSNNVNYDSKIGFHLGLLGHIHLSRQVAFQPEIMYSLQGAKYTNDNVETKLNLGYINVPLLLQYMFDNGFRLEAGPQVGFLVNAKAVTKDVSVNVKDQLKSVDFGLGIGMGYVNPSSGFGIDARYNLGLSNINNNSTVKSTNRGFQLGVFYLFNHK